MWYRKDAWNWALNTISVAPRALNTAWNGILDTGRAALFNALNFGTRLWDRAKDIKAAVNNAANTWTNKQKFRRVPASIISWLGSSLTWLLRDATATWRDLVWDCFQVFWNAFNNAWSAIKRMWKKDKVWDFKFAKIETTDPTMPSVLPTWFKPL